MEWLQRRFIGILSRMECFNYEERPERLGFFVGIEEWPIQYKMLMGTDHREVFSIAEVSKTNEHGESFQEEQRLEFEKRYLRGC